MGCDVCCGTDGSSCTVFQSTHPHGVRHFLVIMRQCWKVISIHAPAWGATSGTAFIKTSCRNFNPRTRMGCDLSILSITKQYDLFQSTHPHGVRRESNKASLIVILFQSTHPHGVRLDNLLTKAKSISFQSTHPHGVRQQYGSCESGESRYFNPRTRMGCD